MGILRMWSNRRKVLGQNERNLSYIKGYNSLQAKRFSDDKLLTKKILTKEGIPTPKLLGVMEDYQDAEAFDWNSLPNSFVIKPVSGLEGGGIEIFFNRDKEGNWIKADGSRYSVDTLKSLVSDIVDGKFSLHNQPDRVMFEERVRMHKGFQYYTHKGVPDVRVIVFNSIPIMSYVRLPTMESDGKANLAIGAIGVGIDISTGVTTTAIKGKAGGIEKIPGTNLSVSGLKIPFWNRILTYAVQASQATGLGFVGVDFLIDRDLGPMIVELNARPGLSIQLANEDGLRWRLRKARGLKVQSVEKGVRLGKDLFGGDIEADIERISGKSLIGIQENITLYNPQQSAEIAVQNSMSNFHSLEHWQDEKSTPKLTVKAKIDTGADSTSADYTLLRELGYGRLLDFYDEVASRHNESNIDERLALVNNELSAEFPNESAQAVKITSSHGNSLRLAVEMGVKLGDFKYITRVNLYQRESLQFKVIVGRKSLSRFLVEPTRKEA